MSTSSFEGRSGDATYLADQRYRGASVPADFGFKSWTLPLDGCGVVSTIAASGVIQSAKIHVEAPDILFGDNHPDPTITTFTVVVKTAGATLTNLQCGFALYSPARVLLGSTFSNAAATDLHTALASTGLVSGTLTAASTGSLTALPEGDYFVAVSQVGTTPAILLGNGAVNVNGLLAASASKYATNDTMTTAFPSTLGTSSAYAGSFFVGLS